MNKVKDASASLRHVAIIMDGNRRWAKQRNLPIVAGHKAGADALQKIIEAFIELKLEYLTVYAFSTENWNRAPKEVEDLMNLLREYLVKLESDNQDRNVRIRVVGDINRLDEDIRNKIQLLEKKTADNLGLTINIALNYGGRNEIIHAIKSLSCEELDNLTIDSFNKKLYTSICLSYTFFAKFLPDSVIIILL